VFGNYTYGQNGVLYFHKTKFHQGDVRFDENELLPWMQEIANHSSLKKALSLIQAQYVDLARRLNLNNKNRAEFQRKFGKKSPVFDSDERDLSAMGLKLAKLSENFIANIQPTFEKLEIARMRGETLEGLNSFDISLDTIEQKVSQKKTDNKGELSNPQAIEAMDSLVDELNRALENLKKATGR
jgi:hypothetical protein